MSAIKKYVSEEGFTNSIDDSELQVVYNNVFSEVHHNSISTESYSRSDLKKWLQRVLFIGKCLTKIPVINRNVGLVGREKEKNKLKKMIDQNEPIVLISGLGGIGKTAIMRWICNEIKEDECSKNHVAWITCSISLKDDLLALCESLGVNTGQGREEDYKSVITKLKKIDGTLYLFLDNMAYKPEDDVREDLNLLPNVRVIISSRHKIDDIPKIELSELEPEFAVDMFYGYYNEGVSRKFNDVVMRIVETVYRHTLLIELLAKAAKKRGGNLPSFYDDLISKKYFDVFDRKIENKHDKLQTIQDSVEKLYKISCLSPEQQEIMKLFSIFQSEKEIFYKIVDWAKFNMDAIDELVDLAWLKRGGIENGYIIHQIVKDSLNIQINKENKGEKIRLENYGELIDRVIDTNTYLSVMDTYEYVRERIVIADGIAGYLSEMAMDYIEHSSAFRSSNDNKRTSVLKSKEGLSKAGLLLHNLAGVYLEQGYYDKAIEYYEKAIKIREAVFGNKSQETIMTYNAIGLAYWYKGRYNEAQSYYENAINIQKNLLKIENHNTAQLYNNLGLVYSYKGYYEKALECYNNALSVLGNLGIGCSDYIVKTYNNIAIAYEELGNYERALEYFFRALSVKKNISKNEDSDVIMIRNNIAMVYSKLGKFEDSKNYYNDVLEFRKRVLGEEHPDTARTYNDIALLYSRLGEHEKAFKFYERALNIQKKILNPEHTDIAKTYNNIAGVHKEIKEYEEALYYYDKALKIQHVVYGKEHPLIASTYNNMGAVHEEMHDFQKALQLYKKSLEISVRFFGNTHHSIAMTYNNIAGVYFKQNNIEKAHEYYDKAIDIYENILGNNHPELAKTYFNISGVYLDKGDFFTALDYQKKAYKMHALYFGEEHCDTLFIKECIIKLEKLLLSTD